MEDIQVKLIKTTTFRGVVSYKFRSNNQGLNLLEVFTSGTNIKLTRSIIEPDIIYVETFKDQPIEDALKPLIDKLESSPLVDYTFRAIPS